MQNTKGCRPCVFPVALRVRASLHLHPGDLTHTILVPVMIPSSPCPGGQEPKKLPSTLPNAWKVQRVYQTVPCDAAGCCLDAHRESCGPETWGFRHWRKQVSLRLQTVETQWSTLVQLLGLWCPLAQSVCPPDKALRAFSLLLQFGGDSWVQTKQISLPGAELISYVLHEGVLGPSQC